jgi:polysaccharide pyruvyl transferase WcaK-like protein
LNTDRDSEARGLPVALAERVMVLGGYGVRNVGDEAMLAGILTRLARERVTVVSRNPYETASMHQVTAVTPIRALALLPKHDVLLIGGGGLFSSQMGLAGRLIPTFGLLASLLSVRVIIEGVDIDRQSPAFVRKTLRLLLSRCSSITVRDRVSRDSLATWGVQSQVAPDLSTFMPCAPLDSRFAESLGLRDDRPCVGLCLNGVNSVDEARVLEVMPLVMRRLPNVTFCFIAMSQHPTASHQNDLRLAHQLKERVPELLILEDWLHPQQILGVFCYLSAAVCMRYHSLLFAQRAGVPIVGLPYAEKCRRWLEEAGEDEAPFDADSLTARLEAIVAAPSLV